MSKQGYQQVLAAVRKHRDNLDAYKALGDISVKQHGTLLLFSYRAGAAFSGTWNEAERVCRGLIVDYKTCRLVAVPFEKFFNLGERPETQLDALPSGPFEVTAKLDGSLGIFYQNSRGTWAIATRGSFTSSQAAMATTIAMKNYNFAWVPSNLTLLFEIIYPENRIVCDYGKDAMLTLIGARAFNQEGEVADQDYVTLRNIAHRCGCPVVASYTFDSPAQLVDLAQHMTGIEGWVLRYPGGFRVKVKTADYVRLHRLITGFSIKRVHETLINDTYDLYIVQLPDQLREQAGIYAKTILDYVTYDQERLYEYFDSIAPQQSDFHGENGKEVRKAFALTVTENCYPVDHKYLFTLAKGQDIRSMILKNAPLSLLFPTAPEDLEQGDL